MCVGDVSVGIISSCCYCWCFNICIWCCWCVSCGRLLVVVSVGGAFIFVCDGHFSQADSDLHCRIIIRVRVDDLFAGVFFV